MAVVRPCYLLLPLPRREDSNGALLAHMYIYIYIYIYTSYIDSVEKLLGKRGSIGDRHSLAAEDLLSRLRGVRTMATAKRCAWDELAALY